MKILRFLPIVSFAALAACDASFTDDRPSGSSADGAGPADDATVEPDAGSDDASVDPDAAPPPADGGPGDDAAPAVDGAPPPPADQGVTAGAVGKGPWQGRSGYKGEGTAELYRNADGSLTLKLSSDFSVSSVPAPVLLLSTRPDVGKAIDAGAGDVHLGELKNNSGAAEYPVPEDKVTDAHTYAWVYCEPFGVEVARAELKP